MNNRDLDMFQKLNNYASPIDLDKMWAGIEPSLPKAKERKPIAWWPWSLMGLCLLAGAYFYWLNTTETIKQPEVHAAPLVEAVPVLDPRVEKQTVMLDAMKKSANLPGASVFAVSEGHTIPIHSTSKGQVKHKEVSFAAELNQPGHAATALQASSSSVHEQSSASLPQQAELHSSSLVASHFKQHTAALGQLPFALSLLPVPSSKTSFKRPDPQTGCYDWSGRKGRLRPYVGIYGGAHLPIRSMEARSAEFTVWAATREATETRLEAVNAGAFFGLQAKNGLSIDAGVEYLRINERFKASDTISSVIGQYITLAFIVNAPGDTTFVRDTVDIMQTTVNTRTTYNRYGFLSIPIGVGYTFNQKHAIKPYIKAGAQFNLTTTQKVGMLDANGQYQLYDSKNTSASTYPFRAQIGVMPFIQVGTRIALTGALEAFGEVRYLHMLRDVTNDNFALNQRYSTIGAQVGLRLGL